ncbi:relaxase/mobilization nuclease domain-containing protein [Haloarcula salinisoli]|uniref:relaxase/mobilization nuclease domain-containing protein n=1 Tax=Haloarcula salinisoli TaxID=2487746 RepID=UPI001F37E1A1|nr:relaxase [Halomicroarcula salinisoli]
MMLKTDFRTSGAGNLVDYIQRDRSQDAVQTVDVRNPTGRQLSDAEVDQFVEKSQQFQFQRHMIISPDPDGQYSPAEVSANTQEVMNREFGNQPTTDYVYAVHRDTAFPHAHVAATGRESELEMDRTEINHLRERASSIYNEPERTRDATKSGADAASKAPSKPVSDDTRAELHERELALEEHPEKEVLQAREQSQERSPTQPSAEKNSDTERTESRQQQSDVIRDTEQPTDPKEEAEAEAEPEKQAEARPDAEPTVEPEPDPERDINWSTGE